MPTPSTTYTSDDTVGAVVQAYLKTADDFYVLTADGFKIVFADHNLSGIYTADSTTSTSYTED